MTRRSKLVAALVALAALAACTGGDPSAAPSATVAPTAQATPAADVAPFHAVPADSVFASGTATCRFTPGPDGGTGAGWVAICELDMTDPRVSGSERQAGFRFIVQSEQPPGLVFVADECSITNDGGSWRGSVQGTDDWDVGAILEGHYVGAGAYAGLEFHYYIADQAEGPTRVLGWIIGGG
jgi:hypothetical protein